MKPTNPARLGLLLYLFVNGALLVLKLAHRPPVATWSWWAVTGLLWAPWALLLAGLCLGLGWRLVAAGRPR